MPERIKKSFVIPIYFALTISTLLVFWQVINFDFINADDGAYVYENPHVLSGLTVKGVIWSFTTSDFGYWQPLTWISLMLDGQLYGTKAAGYHFTNLFFHIANTLLLFFILKKMTGSLWQSAFASAVFAIHPLHVESVAWISERKDIISTLFWLLTMMAYLRYIKKPSTGGYLLTMLAFALGLMAKPMLVTLPFVLLLLDYWPLERIKYFQWRTLYHLVLEKIPFFAVSAISSVITFLTQKVGGDIVEFTNFPLKIRIANAFSAYAIYISKMFWPQHLAIFYPLHIESIRFWQAVMGALLLLIISVFVIYLGRNHRYLPVGWFWFVGTLIPVIGLVRYTSSAYADRYTYVPYIGLFLMLAWGLPQLLSKLPQREITLGVSTAIVLATLGICAYRQTSYWNDSITLFSHALKVTQNNYIAYNNLGIAYGKLGRLQATIDACKQAIKIDSDYADAHYNLGIAYSKLGRTREAIDAFKEAIRTNPNDVKAYCNLGTAYNSLGRRQEALDTFEQAVRIKPDDALVHYNLGIAYGNLGRLNEAINAFKQAIKIKPDYAEAHINLGSVYVATGDKSSAMAEYNTLKSLNPELANKLLNKINR